MALECLLTMAWIWLFMTKHRMAPGRQPATRSRKAVRYSIVVSRAVVICRRGREDSIRNRRGQVLRREIAYSALEHGSMSFRTDRRTQQGVRQVSPSKRA